jgi:hypothetical protein
MPWWSFVMPDYRCYVLDEHQHILFPAEITADYLGAAVRHGLGVLYDAQTRNRFSEAASIEIWEGDKRVFPTQRLDS